MTGPADSRRDIMAFDLGTRIVELRGARGLSQEALANELGISRQAVSRWERGEALPDTENLIALADLFGVTLDELVRGSSPEPEMEAETEVAAVADSRSKSPDESPKHRIKAIGMALIFVGMALIFLGTILRFSNLAPFGGSSVSPATNVDDLPPIEREEVSLPDKLENVAVFAKSHRKFSFRDLLERQSSRTQVVVTFLAVLDLARLHTLVFTIDDNDTIWFSRGDMKHA